MLVSVVISLTFSHASQIIKETEQSKKPDIYTAGTSYTLGAQSESSCAQFDLKVEGGKWECNTFDEHGQCELKCTTGKILVLIT